MNKLLMLLTLSVVLFSCVQNPLCDDPNASNYQDTDNYCQYPASINFYFHPNTLELIRDKAPADSNNSYIIRPHCKNNSIDVNSFEWYSGYIYVSNSNDFKGPNVQIPTDCNYPYLNSIIFGDFYENPAGAIEDIWFTLEYNYNIIAGSPDQNEDPPIVIWEGEVHFDPSDPCKIIEIIYE